MTFITGLTDAQFRASPPSVTINNASLAVTGTFFQATQPVSGTVSISGTVPVSGTFWQATQPVSLTSTTITGSVAVTGSFYQATQPVSIAATVAISAASLPLPAGAAQDVTLTGGLQKVINRGGAKGTTVAADITSISVDANTQALHTNVTNFPASQAVTGTFYQATQPVSIATMPSTPVTGTFWQTTQPVSGTVTVGNASLAVTGTFFQTTQPVSIATMPSTPVTGTFWQTTQPVSGTVTINAIPTGANTIGNVGLVAGAAAIGTVSINAALPAGTNAIGTTMGPTLTKATQGTTGYSVQDLKDSGRAIVNAATAIAGVTAVTTEALVALNVSRDGATTASVTTIAVTSGKRYRVTQVIIGMISTAAAVLSGRFSLRMNPAGAVTATSPIIATTPISSGAALAQAGGQAIFDVPDGIEFSGTMQIGVSQVCSAATGTIWVSVLGYEY